MPDPTPQEIQTFLEELSGLLSQGIDTIDFDDLFVTGAGDDPEAVSKVTPDDIEAAIVMGLQRAEIAKKELEEEKRVAAQWDIVDAVQKRNETMPGQPDGKSLETVDPSSLADIPPLLKTCEQTAQVLGGARGGPDDAFEKAAAAAFQALDARDAAIERNQEAVRKESERRKQAIAGLEQRQNEIVGSIHPVTMKMQEEAKPPPSVRKLKEQLGLAQGIVSNVKGMAASGAPAVFNDAADRAGVALEALPKMVKSANTLGETKEREDRAGRFNQQPSEAPALAKGDIALLGESETLKSRDEKIKAWRALYEKLKQLVKPGPEPLFNSTLEETQSAYDAADKAHGLASQEAETERKRRAGIYGKLNGERIGLAKPKEVLIGTTESDTFDAAAKEAAETCAALSKLQTDGSADAFKESETKAAEAVGALGRVRGEAIVQAGERKKEADELKKQFTELAQTTNNEIKSGLATCPIPDIANTVGAAFRGPVRKLLEKIEGKNAQADRDKFDQLKEIKSDADILVKKLSGIDAAKFAQVAKNAEIVARLDELTELLKTPGIGKSAANKAEELIGDVGKIAERYQRIEMLQIQIDGRADKKIVPDAQKIVNGFADLVNSKDGLKKGQLTTETNKFVDAIRKIEKAIQDKKDAEATEEAKNKYLVSEAYVLLQLMRNENSTTVVAKIGELVGAGKASIGAISDAYQSSWDKPDKFSVEVPMLVDTYKDDFVVHAHCATDGEPLPGNACHVKQYLYRFDPGGYMLPNTLRSSLLPAKTACLSKAKSKKLVPA